MDRGVALVGSGTWGRNLARNLADLDVLACVCDTDRAVLDEQAQLHPEVTQTTSFQEVLESGDVRAVVLATPAASHAALALEAIRAGKDVLVEKPLALRFGEGRDLVEAADAAGAVLMVGHILEYHPAVRKLQELVASGELGELRYIYSNRLNLGKVRTEENILWSFAPHDISIITSLVGEEPVQVGTWGGSYLQADIADVTVTNLSFRNGVRAHIFVSWLHPFKEQRLVVVGDRKMAVFADTTEKGKLRVYDKGIEWDEGVPVARDAREVAIDFAEEEPMRLELEHFLACVKDRSRPLTDGANGLRVLKVLEASQASLENGGRVVSLSEVGG